MFKHATLFLKLLVIIITAVTAITFTIAQDETVTVPDISGLTVPVAAAELNRAGLRLGTETAFGWTEASGLPANTITEQSFAAGESVPFGTTIDITVLRANNVTMVYDDNDVTMINQSGGTIALGAIAFNSVGGNSTASFSAARWGGSLSPNSCGQLWSVGRTGSKDVDGCTESTLWLTTNDTNQHFWTGTNGATQFNVIQNGVERGLCTISVPGTCSFFLESSGSLETTSYLYIAYTDQNSWTIYNNSENLWMSLRGVFFSPTDGIQGGEVLADSVSASDFPDRVVGDVTLLAPNQCIFLKEEASEATDPPISCDTVASYTFPTGTPLTDLTTPLYITASSDGEQRSCPPFTEGRLTVCILPG
ncbi:MAG: PASTA domain-containing protein [Aggregatilineales bacterium]